MINRNVHCRTLTCCHCVDHLSCSLKLVNMQELCTVVIIARLVKDPVTDKRKWQKNQVGNADLGPVLCPVIYVSLYVSLQISATASVSHAQSWCTTPYDSV